MTTKAIFLDLVGTVFNHRTVARQYLDAYLKQCTDPVWRPLELHESFREMKAFPDAKEGLARLWESHKIVALSNLPKPLVEELVEANALPFTHIIALEDIQRYKPHPKCYLHACDQLNVHPSDGLMVTANPTFADYPIGDIHIARACGMQTRLIRREGCPQTLIELAEELGC